MTAVALGSNVSAREVSPTAYLWDSWAAKKSVASIEPSSITYQSYTAYIYEAHFTGLIPDTEYKYMFEWESGGETFRTSVPTTRTWPSSGGTGNFSFIAYGDNRYKDSSATFNADHQDVACLGILGAPRSGSEATPRFILHVGDFVYDGGHADEWIPHFFRPAGALLSRVPVFPCVGNHETMGGDSGATNYRKLFTLPDVEPQDPDDAERWYSFDYGRCHFICLDTESDFSTTSDQYKWLIKGDHPKYETGDLPEAWKGKTSYGTLDRIFVFFHRPAYSSGPHRGEQEAEDLRTILVPKFKQYKVDMVFSGHEHLYERISEGGIQYVVTGGGGAPEAAIVLSHNLGQWGAVREEWCDYTRRPDDWRHYCVVSVSGEDSDVSLRVNSWKQNLIDWWPREE